MILSPLARCVYRELLDQCWKHGSLPKDHEILAKMALVSSREFRSAWKEISPLFEEKNGEFHHELVDEKRPQLVEYKRNRSESGRKGAQAKLQAEPRAKLPARGQHSHKLSSSTASGCAQAPIPIPIPTEREAAVEIPKQTGAAAATVDWNGPDAGQEIRALVEQLAQTWPNPGSAPQAISAAEREWAKSGSDVGEWCGKVRKSAESWRSYHQAERGKNPKHFTPQLSRWFYDGDYSRQAPVAGANKPKPATCPECLNTGWVMLADLPAEAISGVWDSKQLDAWQALNRRRCSCVARAG